MGPGRYRVVIKRVNPEGVSFQRDGKRISYTWAAWLAYSDRCDVLPAGGVWPIKGGWRSQPIVPKDRGIAVTPVATTIEPERVAYDYSRWTSVEEQCPAKSRVIDEILKRRRYAR